MKAIFSKNRFLVIVWLLGLLQALYIEAVLLNPSMENKRAIYENHFCSVGNRNIKHPIIIGLTFLKVLAHTIILVNGLLANSILVRPPTIKMWQLIRPLFIPLQCHSNR
jgi:hypothetical protein